MSRPTVDKTLASLLSLNLIEENGTRSTRQGRPATLFCLRNRAWLALGIDLELPEVEVVVTDVWGRIEHERRFELRDDLDKPQVALTRLSDSIKAWLAELNISTDQLGGLGVGLPGFFSPEGVTFLGRHLPRWQRVPVRRRLGTEFGIPVLVGHDVHFMALAEVEERKWGDRIVLFLSVRPGLENDIRIGASLCLTGRTYRGAHGNGGALCQAVVDEEELLGLTEKERIECIANRLNASLMHIVPLVDPDLVVVHAEYLGTLERDLIRSCQRNLEAALEGEYMSVPEVIPSAVRGESGAQRAALAVIQELLRPEETAGIEGGVTATGPLVGQQAAQN